MKPQNKNIQGLYLQKRNNRWKWMAAATAATAAGVTGSQAYGITINLLNNYISGYGGNHLNADLTGDGHPDFTLANAGYRLLTRPYYGTRTGYTRFYAGVTLNGVRADARRRNYLGSVPDFGTEVLGSRTAHYTFVPHYIYGTPSLTGSIPLFFKDLHINGGAPTMGLLQVTVSTNPSRTRGGAVIQLDSFSYNTPVQGSSRAVPDHGSSLALLAMGAGGVLAFRRWRATQEHS